MGTEVPYYNPFYFFEQIYLFLKMIEGYFFAVSLTLEWRGITIVLNVLSLSLFIFFVVIMHRAVGINRKEKNDFMARFDMAKDPEQQKNQEWQDILDHMDSDNESQWKLALIDADKILEDALRVAGYDGATLGDRLKMAESTGGFKSIQDAWEAHKVRNRIAHESGFVLTFREARRAIELYKVVLQDLHFL
ncbi:MAG: hypothetical protein HY226_01695 [Candidatus Vogelbacteria bacterium]|nr:hypothetical protein [Candidatus Vogelbacteria bacterium]